MYVCMYVVLLAADPSLHLSCRVLVSCALLELFSFGPRCEYIHSLVRLASGVYIRTCMRAFTQMHATEVAANHADLLSEFAGCSKFSL
jgi:hypothetical protein